jgi:hypothetical protein
MCACLSTTHTASAGPAPRPVARSSPSSHLEGERWLRFEQVVGAHPNVLAYSVPTRLQPAIEYLQEIGVTDIATVIKERPSLLGLDPEEQLKRGVGYFKANDYTQEQIIELVSKNI